MDIISHGLWGGVVLGRRRGFLGAVLFGLLPDILAFSPYLAQRAILGGVMNIFAAPLSYPPWVYALYNSTHSLVVAGLIFIVLWSWQPKLAILFLAWPLHIMLDIPCHSADSFPTKFLYPLSHFYFDGVHWKNLYILIANWVVLAITYSGYAISSRIKAASTKADSANPLKPDLFQPLVHPAGNDAQPADEIDITKTSDAKSTCSQQTGFGIDQLNSANGQHQEQHGAEKGNVGAHPGPAPIIGNQGPYATGQEDQCCSPIKEGQEYGVHHGNINIIEQGDK